MKVVALGGPVDGKELEVDASAEKITVVHFGFHQFATYIPMEGVSKDGLEVWVVDEDRPGPTA